MPSNVDALEEARALLADGAEVVHLRDRKERDPVLGMVTVDDSADLLPLIAALVAELEAARAVVEAADTVRMTAQSGPQPGSVTVPRSAMRELDRAMRAHIAAAKAGKAVE